MNLLTLNVSTFIIMFQGRGMELTVDDNRYEPENNISATLI